MGSPNATIFIAARAPSQETKLPQSKGQMMMAMMMMMTCYPATNDLCINSCGGSSIKQISPAILPLTHDPFSS